MGSIELVVARPPDCYLLSLFFPRCRKVQTRDVFRCKRFFWLALGFTDVCKLYSKLRLSMRDSFPELVGSGASLLAALGRVSWPSLAARTDEMALCRSPAEHLPDLKVNHP